MGSPEVAIGPPPLPPRPNTVCLLSENSFQEIDENNIRMERFRDYFAQYERFRDYFAHKRGSVIFIINNYASRPFSERSGNLENSTVKDSGSCNLYTAF